MQAGTGPQGYAWHRRASGSGQQRLARSRETAGERSRAKEGGACESRGGTTRNVYSTGAAATASPVAQSATRHNRAAGGATSLANTGRWHAPAPKLVAWAQQRMAARLQNCGRLSRASQAVRAPQQQMACYVCCHRPKKGRTLRRGCSSRPHTSRLQGSGGSRRTAGWTVQL
jgi:hypothetical protein